MSEPICPYCGKALEKGRCTWEDGPPTPLAYCPSCRMEVPWSVAESRPFRVEWGRAYALFIKEWDAPEGATHRRLVSKWEADRE